jgi:GGDEF domain-containing protein
MVSIIDLSTAKPINDKTGHPNVEDYILLLKKVVRQ